MIPANPRRLTPFTKVGLVAFAAFLPVAIYFNNACRWYDVDGPLSDHAVCFRVAVFSPGWSRLGVWIRDDRLVIRAEIASDVPLEDLTGATNTASTLNVQTAGGTMSVEMKSEETAQRAARYLEARVVAGAAR